jgi:YesN/AraC family two-component response regulator
VQNLDQVFEISIHKYNYSGIGTTFYNLDYLSRSNRQNGQKMFAFKGGLYKDKEVERPGSPNNNQMNVGSVPFNDMNGHKTYEYAFLFELEEGLCSTIMRSTTKKIQGKLDYIALSLECIQPDDTTAALRVYLHLTHAIIRTIYKAGFTLNEIMGTDVDPCAHMEQFKTKQEIHNYVEAICLHICKYMAALCIDKNQRIVWEVKSYIEEHFKKDFGLEHLSERVNRSSTYINRLLKQYTGSTFYNLLTEKRIVCSKQLLSLDNWTVNQISNEVGYNNVHSFIRAFKRNEGVTPGKFRDLIVGNAIEFE